MPETISVEEAERDLRHVLESLSEGGASPLWTRPVRRWGTLQEYPAKGATVINTQTPEQWIEANSPFE
jgi:hypothetical protein